MARKAGITHAQVVDAAVAIVDRDGPDSLSLTRVGADLGVRSPSLYAHIDGLQGLRRDVAWRATALLTERLRVAAAAHSDPSAALRALAHAYRAFGHDHPGLYSALLPAPRPDDDPEGAALAAETVAVVAAVLGDLGVTPQRHIDLIRMLRALLHGFVDLELGGGFGLPNPVDASFDAALDVVLRALAEAGGA